MNTWNIYSIIVTVAFVLLGFLSTYLKTKSKVIAKIAEFITKAEEIYKSTTGKGGEKHELVIDWAFALVPAPLKPFITREFIANTLDKIFEQVQDYSTMQLDKVVDKIVDDGK